MIKKSYINSFITLSLLLWTALFIMQFIQLQEANKISYFAAKVELIIHIITVFFLVKAYKKTSLANKPILFYLLISISGIFINDAIFYCLIYFKNNYVPHLSSINFILNILPFFIWVVATIIFFYKILRITFHPKDFCKILFIFIALNATVLFLCFSSIPYATSVVLWQKLLQLTGYITESLIFDLSILCLIYSKNKGLSWISAGFPILISGDFLLTYTHLTQTDNTLGIHGELFWFLGLLFILFGIYFIKNNTGYKKILWLRKSHSIKHIFAFWTFKISLLSILPLFILAYFFLPINKEIFLLLPSGLIAYSIILVIFSLIMGHHLETPFKQLESNIDALILKKDKTKVNALFLIEEFIFLQNFLNKVVSAGEKRDREKQALINTTTQVVHDIRSPLAAINTALLDVASIPESKRIMIRNAAKRINEIANNLLLQSKNYSLNKQDINSVNNDFPELIFMVLDNIVAEKRYEYYKTNISITLNISDCSYNCFSTVNLTSFKRILSNLINNSIEAVNSNGSVLISLACNANDIIITIEDNGCGIPSNILPKITEQGFSFNKTNGSGLGLSFTKRYIEQINGTMQIHSEEKVGTQITINLIQSNHPKWFCNSISIKLNYIIVILDDDQSIHDAWDERFSNIHQVKLIHHYNITELLQNKIDPMPQVLYLIDYELIEDSKNGLDVIEELKLNKKAILVTSCF